MSARAQQAAASLLPRLALWRAAMRAEATKPQPLLHPSMFASTQGRAASTGLLRAATTATATTAMATAMATTATGRRPFHTSPLPSGSSLWSRLVRSSGASSDPLGRAANVTNFLIAANLAVALAAASGLAPSLPAALARANWLVSPGGEWYRMLTSGFVHSGWVHLLVNAYALHALRDLEGLFGGRRYLAIYALSIVAGNWLGLWQTPPYTVACGASGGVCGLVGAFVAARVANRSVRRLTIRDFSWVAQIVGLNLLVQALNSSGAGGGGARIDQLGHVGGALGGAAAALLLGPRLRWARSGAGLVDAPPLPVLLWRGGRVPPGW